MTEELLPYIKDTLKILLVKWGPISQGTLAYLVKKSDWATSDEIADHLASQGKIGTKRITLYIGNEKTPVFRELGKFEDKGIVEHTYVYEGKTAVKHFRLKEKYLSNEKFMNLLKDTLEEKLD